MIQERSVVICTGPPGNGRDEILLKMKEKVNFHYHHMFKYIVDVARRRGTVLNKLNILDFYDSQPEKMESYHREAVREIADGIQRKNGLHIISTPFHFEWKGNRFSGLHSDEVEVLEPDFFIIIFDDMLRVRDRLGKDSQWKDHRFTLGEIANWRREEISGVYELAEVFTPKKDILLVAFENGAEFLRDVVLNRRKERVYLSHPITGEDDAFFQKVQRFASSISDHYVVFDPYMVKDWSIVDAWREMINKAYEMGSDVSSQLDLSIEYSEGRKRYELDSAEVESAIKNIRFQVIDNDYKIIENCSSVVVYHPRKSISAGVMCEMVYAKSMAKMVYAYYPYEPSPFFEWYATRIFTDEDELRNYLIAESKLTGQTPLDFYVSKDGKNT